MSVFIYIQVCICVYLYTREKISYRSLIFQRSLQSHKFEKIIKEYFILLLGKTSSEESKCLKIPL